MAKLNGVGKSLRFSLELVDRQAPIAVPGSPSPPASLGRLLGSASVEYFDKRDQSFWPMVHLPVVWLGQAEARGLLDHLSALVRGESPGFGFRSESGEVALQVGGQPDLASKVVEVGLDLGNFLNNVAGIAPEVGRDLALFRFATDQMGLVTFGDGLRAELKALDRT